MARWRQRRGWAQWLRASLLWLLCLTLTACGIVAQTTSAQDGNSVSVAPTSTSGTAARTTATFLPGATGLAVFVEPEAGETPVLHMIEGAQHSVWVEVYLLTERNVINALEDAAYRGVDVRVLLELNPYGVGSTSPTETLRELQAADVNAKGSDTAYHYTHEKAIIVDGATLLVTSANLTKSGLGGSSYAANREYGIIDTTAADVHEAAAIFSADWDRTTPALSDPNLVVSPVNARARIASLIASARATLLVEDEEMYDRGSEDGLIAAARRGVNVEVILPQPTSDASNAADVARLLNGGVHLRYISVVYMHAKMMVADGARAFVGSENFSATSLDQNRELGLLIADPQVIVTLSKTFQMDWSDAQDAS